MCSLLIILIIECIRVKRFCNGGELFVRIQQMESFSEKEAADYLK